MPVDTENGMEETRRPDQPGVQRHFPKLEAILASPPSVASERSRESLTTFLAGRVSGLFLDFLKVVARRGRIDLVRAYPPPGPVAIRPAARAGAVPHHHGNAAWTTPRPAQLVGEACELLGGEAMLERVVDPELIGGEVLASATWFTMARSPTNCRLSVTND